MNDTIPLKFPRLIALFLAWAWSLISLAFCINAFVKSKRDEKDIQSEAPPPAEVSINTNDVTQAGAVVATISALILILTTLFIGIIIIDANSRSGISTRTLPLQYISLGFLAVWLFATEIPVSHFIATRSARVVASINGIQLPSDALGVIERALGVSTAYKDFSYLKLLAILPWFAFLFTLVAAVVTFQASRRRAPLVPEKSAEPTSAA